jgi:short-subunit dehydrogenase
LITIAGATIGKCAIVPKEILPANTNQALAIIRLNADVNLKYVFHLIKSNYLRKYIEQNIKGSAQPNLNLEQLNNFIIPYPLPKEQERIDIQKMRDNLNRAVNAAAGAIPEMIATGQDVSTLLSKFADIIEKRRNGTSIEDAVKEEQITFNVNFLNFKNELQRLTKKFLENIDIVLIAHGTLSKQKSCEQSVELTMQELTTNALSVIALLTLLANIFELQKKGTIAVISSVAGDRGRQSNYVYGSAKAMVTAYLSGLRQRLFKSGVAVVNIKPGFVDTPMTAEFKKGLLWSRPSVVAETIVNVCDKGNNNFYVPKFWFFIMIIIKLIPVAIYNKIKL